MNARKVAQVIFILIFLGIAAVGVVWLSGAIYLAMNKINPLGVTELNTWWLYWQQYSVDPVQKKKLALALLIPSAILIILTIAAIIAATRKKRSLHGDARFANSREIEEAGLFPKGTSKGREIIVGQYQGKYLVFGGQQFVLLSAPTRSGKGVSSVIPNLLNYSDSVVVLDIKQENYDLTAGFRAAHGQDVYLFNPFAEDYRTARYNPLTYIRDGDFRIGDLTAIAKTFWPGNDPKNIFWDESCVNLFLGIALYLFETSDKIKTIGETLRQASGKGKAPHEHFRDLINERNFIEIDETDDEGNVLVDEEGNAQKKLVQKTEWREDEEPPLSESCVDALNRFISIESEATRSNIIGSFTSALVIWTNPVVDAATSASDFDLRNVRRKKMSVYVGITPDYLPQASRLLNLFFSQLLNLNTKVLPEQDPTLIYQCLIIFDEMTAPGKIELLAKSVTYQAGYDMRMLDIIQAPSQLESVYGKADAQTFITNHAMQVIFAPRENKDAKEYSEMLGYQTIEVKSKSRSRGNISESTSEQRRALMMPQEIKEMGRWKQIILLENCKPILCDKIRYFKDPVLQKRVAFSKKNPPPEHILNMEEHRANIQTKIAPLTEDNLNSIQLNNLNIDFSTIEVPDLLPDQNEYTNEQLDSFVNKMFAKMGVSAEDLTEEDLQVEENIIEKIQDTSVDFPDVVNLDDERIQAVDDFWTSPSNNISENSISDTPEDFAEGFMDDIPEDFAEGFMDGHT